MKKVDMYTAVSTSTQPKNEIDRTLTVDVVVSKSSAIFKLPSIENESLLIRWDSFLVLNFGFHIFDGVLMCDINFESWTSS